MSLFRPTEIWGTVRFLGVNADEDAGIESGALDTVKAGFDGFEGDCHNGAIRPACVRVKNQYPEDAPIRNTRQVSILSVEEMAETAEAMGLPGPIDPQWLGANLVLEGIPDLSALPPASRLIFENGTGIGVDTENAPCQFPAEVIERHYPGLGKAFPRKARGKRGVVGWIDREGVIALGDRCRLHVPMWRGYAHA